MNLILVFLVTCITISIRAMAITTHACSRHIFISPRLSQAFEPHVSMPSISSYNYELLQPVKGRTYIMQRPFKVLGIQQIAIGGPSKANLRNTLWVDMFGFRGFKHFVSERENVDEDICAMGCVPFKVEVDPMQPLTPKKPAITHYAT